MADVLDIEGSQAAIAESLRQGTQNARAMLVAAIKATPEGADSKELPRAARIIQTFDRLAGSNKNKMEFVATRLLITRYPELLQDPIAPGADLPAELDNQLKLIHGKVIQSAASFNPELTNEKAAHRGGKKVAENHAKVEEGILGAFTKVAGGFISNILGPIGDFIMPMLGGLQGALKSIPGVGSALNWLTKRFTHGFDSQKVTNSEAEHAAWAATNAVEVHADVNESKSIVLNFNEEFAKMEGFQGMHSERLLKMAKFKPEESADQPQPDGTGTNPAPVPGDPNGANVPPLPGKTGMMSVPTGEWVSPGATPQLAKTEAPRGLQPLAAGTQIS